MLAKRKQDEDEEVADKDVTTEGIDVEAPIIDPITDLIDNPYIDSEEGPSGSNDGGLIPENEARSENSGSMPADTLGSGREDEGTE